MGKPRTNLYDIKCIYRHEREYSVTSQTSEDQPPSHAPTPTQNGDEGEQFLDAVGGCSVDDEDTCWVADDKFFTKSCDDTADKFKAGSFTMQQVGYVEDNSDVGGDKFSDIADMFKKRVRAETPNTVQRELVHEAFAVQEDADGGWL